MSSFKPEGYPSLSPYMLLDNPEATLSFVEQLFDGERLRIIKDDGGRIRHAEIRTGDIVLMMGAAHDDWQAMPGHLHLYVEDVDAVYARALSLGAEPIMPPVKHDDPHDPDKRGGFKDPGGISWWIATQIQAG